MTNQRKVYTLGTGWLSAAGYGMGNSNPIFSNSDLGFQYPELGDFIPELPARFGRFDVYTKVCFSTAVLALKNAGLLSREGKKNIGIVVGSTNGVYDDDIAFFESTREAEGEFSSPNLFSYTLPNVALGEIAVFFNFIGPTFCVGNDQADPGSSALTAALSLLESGQCDRILAGWLEVAQNIKNHDNFPKGAAFAALTFDKTNKFQAEFSVGPNFRFSKLFEGQNG
jgi:3-oxoacyl-(acyl-carrier-protein) synthase